jgi:hypothetical protein
MKRAIAPIVIRTPPLAALQGPPVNAGRERVGGEPHRLRPRVVLRERLGHLPGVGRRRTGRSERVLRPVRAEGRPQNELAGADGLDVDRYVRVLRERTRGVLNLGKSLLRAPWRGRIPRAFMRCARTAGGREQRVGGDLRVFGLAPRGGHEGEAGLAVRRQEIDGPARNAIEIKRRIRRTVPIGAGRWRSGRGLDVRERKMEDFPDAAVPSALLAVTQCGRGCSSVGLSTLSGGGGRQG